jgi:hypothetical protein
MGNLTNDSKSLNKLMLRIKNKLVILTLIVLMTSCNKFLPAGFWISYKTELITSKESNQGPWGGHRLLKWRSKELKSFTSQSMLDYAYKNGWILTDSIVLTKDSVNYLVNKDTIDKDYSDYLLKRYILLYMDKSNFSAYRFKTGWNAIEPGNTRETEKNGFVMINYNGTEMIVYHLWGE